MDSTLHTIIAARYIEDRIAEAQAPHAAREPGRRRRIRLLRAHPSPLPRVGVWRRRSLTPR